MINKRVGRDGGTPYTKFVQMVSELGYNNSVSIEIATVTAAAPDLKIRLDAEGLELDKDELIVAEGLTRHERIVSFSGTSGVLTYEDVLKVGDRVIVACLDEDMTYMVLDRAVWY